MIPSLDGQSAKTLLSQNRDRKMKIKLIAIFLTSNKIILFSVCNVNPALASKVYQNDQLLDVIQGSVPPVRRKRNVFEATDPLLNRRVKRNVESKKLLKYSFKFQ